MAIPTIKYKLSLERMKVLQEVLETELYDFMPADQHDYLLYEHLKELKSVLAAKLPITKKECTFSFTGSQVLAFWQYFGMADTSRYPYADVVIRKMIAEFDRYHKNNRTKEVA